MKKFCAILAFIFVLSVAGGAFGQDNRNRRDQNQRVGQEIKRDSDRRYNRKENNYHRRHRRHRHYRRQG